MIFHETHGEPIQQLGMGRCFGAGAKIFARAGQAIAKEMLPYPINRHARRQGILPRHDPVGQVEAIGPITPDVQRRQHGRRMGLHLGTRL